jgi:hypothetical protein
VITFLQGLAASFGLGVIYFVAAVPTGAALGLPVPIAALSGWLGYCAIAAVVAFAGESFRSWLGRKTGFSPTPDPQKWLWRTWNAWGLPGLGLIAPITCGPYIAALIAVTLGQSPARTVLWIAIGGAIAGAVFAAATALGLAFVQ